MHHTASNVFFNFFCIPIKCPTEGSRPLWPQDILTAGHFGSAPTLSWITGGAVSCRNCPGSSVPTLRKSYAEVSRTAFLVQKCFETVLKCLMRVRSVLVPKCLVAEVSGNPTQHTLWQLQNCSMTTKTKANIATTYCIIIIITTNFLVKIIYRISHFNGR